MKKISIIIAVYNIQDYIARCLDSVIKQKGEDIEIIIVDDGSTDNSLNICKSYQKKDQRIMIIHQENKGLNHVRNVGFDKSTGEYIWHIDGDDYIDENSIEVIRRYLDKYDIIYFNHNRVEKDKIEKIDYNKKYDTIADQYILSYNVVWNKIFKRYVFEDERFPEKYSYNDIYIIPTLVHKTRNIKFIKNDLYYYVYRENSLSKTRKYNLDEYVSCLNHVYNTLKDNYYDAVECFYVNQLLLYNYAKEIRFGVKYNYKKLNSILKEKFPNYYKNKYYNRNIYMRIYIRLIYYDKVLLVKFITWIKYKVLNKLKK